MEVIEKAASCWVRSRARTRAMTCSIVWLAKFISKRVIRRASRKLDRNVSGICCAETSSATYL